jgi:hypothetical protein
MPNVYVEARPQGRPEGSSIEDFVVEDHADHVLGTFKTKKRSTRPERNGHSSLARVRHLNDKKIPDHWRAAVSTRLLTASPAIRRFSQSAIPISRNRFSLEPLLWGET